MNQEQIQRAAERIYQEQQRARASYELMGMNITALMQASVEDIAAHIQMIEDVAREFSVNLDYSRFAFGTTREQVVAEAEAKAKAHRRRAGVRALVAKYGPEAASDIVYRKSGKRIKESPRR